MKAIKLCRIKFSNQAQEGPGIHSSAATSFIDPINGKNSRHNLEWHEWAFGGAYWVELYDKHPSRDNAEIIDEGYILPSPGDTVILPEHSAIRPPEAKRGPGRPPRK